MSINNNIIVSDNENKWQARTAVLLAAIADIYITLIVCRVLYRKKSVIRGGVGRMQHIISINI